MCQILDKYLKYTVSIILSKNKHTCMRFEVLKKKFVIDGYIPLFFFPLASKIKENGTEQS